MVQSHQMANVSATLKGIRRATNQSLVICLRLYLSSHFHYVLGGNISLPSHQLLYCEYVDVQARI